MKKLMFLFLFVSIGLLAQTKSQVVFYNEAGVLSINPSLTNSFPVVNKPVKYYEADQDTVTTETDTISAPVGAEIWTFKIIALDTLEFATDASFTTGQIVFTNGTDELANLFTTSFPHIYVRRSGTGTVVYKHKQIGY